MLKKDLEGIPEYMTRDDRDKLLAGCGITNKRDLVSFSMSYQGVTAVVLATDERGRRIMEPNGEVGGGERIAKHRVFIPFVDKAPGAVDDEVFCPKCLAGTESDRHLQTCAVPEQAPSELVHGPSDPERWCPVYGCVLKPGHDGEHKELEGQVIPELKEGPMFCPPDCREPLTVHHHYRDASGVIWSHLTVPKEQEHTECLLPECPGPAVLRQVPPSVDNP